MSNLSDFELTPGSKLPSIDFSSKDYFYKSPSSSSRKKASADSPQIRMTYLIINLIDCPECNASATELCNPFGLTPSVFNTHLSRLQLGENLKAVKEFRADEQRRINSKTKN